MHRPGAAGPGRARHAAAAAATSVARWCLSLALFPRYQPASACAGVPGAAGSASAGSKQFGVQRAPLPWPRPGPAARAAACVHAAGSAGAMGCVGLPAGAARSRCLSHVGPSAQGAAPPGEDLELDVAEARKLASKMRRQRQLDLSFAAAGRQGRGTTHKQPVMMRVYIDQEVRTLLKLAARERRGRVVVDAADPSLAALTAALEARFPIGAVPYKLQARWQHRVAPADDDAQGDAPRQREALGLSDDASVARLFELASGELAPGIRVELHVLMSSKARVKDERASPEILSLIAASAEWCMVSFYSFQRIKHPVAVAEELQTRWSRMGILGRTYVAEEGINAQLAVPDKLIPHIRQQLASDVHLQGARVNVDSRRIAMRTQGRPPFDALYVRVRPQIVVDGLVHPEKIAGGVSRGGDCATIDAWAAGSGAGELDWQDNGEEISALDWHRRLQHRHAAPPAPTPHAHSTHFCTEEAAGSLPVGSAGTAQREEQEEDVVVLDCRNGYESDVGKFQGAVPLNTNTFRDTWEALERELGARDRSKTQVMIYCTGGIRCVKVGAYLKQRMGFEHIGRLQGGVVSYVRELQEHLGSDPQALQEHSQFRGINYVFDNRIGELITPDVPLEQLPSAAADEAPVLDQDGRLAAVRAGPERQHEMERRRKVRECIAVALEQLRSQEGAGRGEEARGQGTGTAEGRGHGTAQALLRSLVQEDGMEREWRNLSVPSWAAVGSRGPASSGDEQCEQQKLRPDDAQARGGGKNDGQSKNDGQGGSERIQRIDLHRVPGQLADADAAGGRGGDALAQSAPPLDVHGFCDKFSSRLLAEPALLEELHQETERSFPKVAHMTSGKLQGSLLSLLCQLVQARRVLELGTFTGYSSLVLAGCSSVQSLVTIERDPLAAAIARRFFERSQNAHKITLRQGDANRELALLAQRPSSSCAHAATAGAGGYNQSLCGRDTLLELEIGAAGVGNEEGEWEAFDLVFLDAGKRDYAEQRAVLLQHNLIRVGGLVVADNVLWAGAVPLHSEALERGEPSATAQPRERHEKVTRALYDYVAQTAQDARWQQLVLPLRDGLSVCRRVA